MSVAKVVELSSTSDRSFEDAINRGLERATRTVHNITSAWIKEQRVAIENNQIREYQVNMLITFILDDAGGRGGDEGGEGGGGGGERGGERSGGRSGGGTSAGGGRGGRGGGRSGGH